jgi:putative transposase
VLQTGLEVEMTDHVGYEPHAVEGRGSGNSRNGSYPKTVTTEIGKVGLRVPRDRNGTFEPVTVRKGERGRHHSFSPQAVAGWLRSGSSPGPAGSRRSKST